MPDLSILIHNLLTSFSQPHRNSHPTTNINTQKQSIMRFQLTRENLQIGSAAAILPGLTVYIYIITYDYFFGKTENEMITGFVLR